MVRAGVLRAGGRPEAGLARLAGQGWFQLRDWRDTDRTEKDTEPTEPIATAWWGMGVGPNSENAKHLFLQIVFILNLPVCAR